MKITESHSLAGFTFLASDNAEIMYASCVRIDGQEYERIVAYDVGQHIAIRGEYDFTGKDVEIVR